MNTNRGECLDIRGLSSLLGGSLDLLVETGLVSNQNRSDKDDCASLFAYIGVLHLLPSIPLGLASEIEHAGARSVDVADGGLLVVRVEL